MDPRREITFSASAARRRGAQKGRRSQKTKNKEFGETSFRGGEEGSKEK